MPSIFKKLDKARIREGISTQRHVSKELLENSGNPNNANTKNNEAQGWLKNITAEIENARAKLSAAVKEANTSRLQALENELNTLVSTHNNTLKTMCDEVANQHKIIVDQNQVISHLENNSDGVHDAQRKADAALVIIRNAHATLMKAHGAAQQDYNALHARVPALIGEVQIEVAASEKIAAAKLLQEKAEADAKAAKAAKEKADADRATAETRSVDLARQVAELQQQLAGQSMSAEETAAVALVTAMMGRRAGAPALAATAAADALSTSEPAGQAPEHISR